MYKSFLYRGSTLLVLIGSASVAMLLSPYVVAESDQQQAGSLMAQQNDRLGQANLNRALYSLLEAQAWLRATSPQAGGPSRVRAIDSTEKGIQATERAIQWAITNSGASRQGTAKPNFQMTAQNERDKLARALTALQEARRNLDLAYTDRAGNRAQALAFTQLAIRDTQTSIEYAQNWQRDPDMIKALNLLRQAETSLKTAKPNKGGHRLKAIQLVQQAIRETELGMDYSPGTSGQGR